MFNRWSFAGFTFFEAALAVLVYETSKAYGKLVPENLRVALQAWTFHNPHQSFTVSHVDAKVGCDPLQFLCHDGAEALDESH